MVYLYISQYLALFTMPNGQVYSRQFPRSGFHRSPAGWEEKWPGILGLVIFKDFRDNDEPILTSE